MSLSSGGNDIGLFDVIYASAIVENIAFANATVAGNTEVGVLGGANSPIGPGASCR